MALTREQADPECRGATQSLQGLQATNLILLQATIGMAMEPGQDQGVSLRQIPSRKSMEYLHLYLPAWMKVLTRDFQPCVGKKH